MNERTHKTFVEGFGPKIARRFRIVDQEKGYWDGEDWNLDPQKALIFHDFQSAARDLKMVQLYENIDKPMKTYIAKVTVEVLSDEPIDLNDLQDYLTDATKLSLTKPMAENEEAVIQIQLHWDDLREDDSGDTSSS